jgi:outer membrane protein OmpA-like peptidoglycan-associated protein
LNVHAQVQKLENMKNYYLLLFAFLFSFGSFGQYTDEELNKIIRESSTAKLVKMNSEMLLNGAYRQAAMVGEELVRKDPSNANFNYRLGYAYLYFHPDIEKPLEFLKKGTAKISLKYDASSEKETGAPIDVIYYYAKELHRVEQIDAAEKEYRLFLEKAGTKHALTPLAELGLQQCEVARKLISNPTQDGLANLGMGINTKGPEYAPAISLDGSALFFTSRRLWPDSSNYAMIDPSTNFYLEDIYVSTLGDDEKWSPSKILAFCKPDQNEASVSVSIDERRVYVYNDASGGGDIYYSNYARGEFDAIKSYGVAGVNTKAWEPHLYVTPDGSEIYFVSDRPGGYGGRDIYFMKKKPDGSWSEPKNCGPEINTPFDEDAPFISIDNYYLYFASNGPKSMGGFDIFVAERDADGNWKTPENMGYPINSTGDDAFYTTTTDGFKGYISSFRKGGLGDMDIYEILHNPPRSARLSVLKGQIFVIGDKPLPEDIAVTVTCKNCDKPTQLTVFPRLRDGVYFTGLDKCKEYEVSFTHGDYKQEFYKTTINSTCEQVYEEIYRPAYLRLDDMTIVPYYGLKINTVLANQSPVQSVLIEILDTKGNLLATVNSNEDGFAVSELLRERKQGETTGLQFRISKDGFLSKTVPFDVLLGDQNLVLAEIMMEPAKVGEDLGKILKLNPIYFDLNSSYIRADAKPELQKIIDAMNANPNMVIECGSHTDCRESYKYNEWLSERRAKRTIEYIQKRITNPSRISGKGYGEYQLVNDCECEGTKESTCSEDQHQLNRRTEFIIVKQ